MTTFTKMMTRRTGERDLAGWLERVEADDQLELYTFAAGVRHDLAAVTAGLTLPYTPGATEATSTSSKQSRGRCTAAPASTSSAFSELRILVLGGLAAC